MKKGIIGIVLAIVFVMVLGLIVLAAASGFVRIPILNSILGTDKPKNLGINSEIKIFEGMLNKNGISITGTPSNYCLTCNIKYSNPLPMEVEVSSEDLTSYLKATNNENGPMKNIQIKLDDNNRAEMSAYINLKEYGYDFEGPVYFWGTFEKDGDNQVKINLEKAKAGILPIPNKYVRQSENALDNMVNGQLRKMTGLKIDDLSIESQSLHFKGIFPKTISID